MESICTMQEASNQAAVAAALRSWGGMLQMDCSTVDAYYSVQSCQQCRKCYTAARKQLHVTPPMCGGVQPGIPGGLQPLEPGCKLRRVPVPAVRDRGLGGGGPHRAAPRAPHLQQGARGRPSSGAGGHEAGAARPPVRTENSLAAERHCTVPHKVGCEVFKVQLGQILSHPACCTGPRVQGASCCTPALQLHPHEFLLRMQVKDELSYALLPRPAAVCLQAACLEPPHSDSSTCVTTYMA